MMTLKFFRKHRKYFMLLMAAAVFAMVTFSALVYAPQALQQLTGRPEDKVAFIKVYDQPVTRLEGYAVQDRLAMLAQFDNWARQQAGMLQYRKAVNPKDPNIQKEANQIDLMCSYNTGQARRYRLAAEAGRASQRKVLEDTIVLLHEADRAGVRVTDDMVQAFVDRWKAAGITEEMIQQIRRQCFTKNNQDAFLKALGQEMTLSIYLYSLVNDARVFKDDVAQEFSLANDRVKIREAVINTDDFLTKAPEPTEEQIKAQYEKYKDVLATDAPDAAGVVQPFGYKIPDRVKFSYLSAAVADAEKDVKVSDDEIKQYYETHKDSFELPEEVKPQTPKAEEKKPAAEKSEAPKADEKKGAANEKSGQPAPAKAKVLNAPAASAEPAPAASTAVKVPAKAAPATTAAPAPTAAPGTTAVKPVTPPVKVMPVQAAPSQVPPYLAAPSAADMPEMPTKPKKYKPLDQVRDEIVKTLRHQKAEEATWKRCQDAINALGAKPQLTLEYVADERYMKIHQTNGLLSAAQVAKISGIGQAKYSENPQSPGLPLDKVVFLAKPFVKDIKEEKVHLNRPFGPLVDEHLGKVEAMYVLFLTETEAARPPASLAEVRVQVVADLKKMAAFDLAKKAADELLTQARAKGLEAAAKAKDLKAEVLVMPIVRMDVQSKSNPLAKAAFAAADADQKYGKVDSPTFSQVRVFEVTEVLRGTQEQYRQERSQLAATALNRARGNFIRELLDSKNIRKRSNLQDLEPLAPGEKVIQGQGPEQDDSSSADFD